MTTPRPAERWGAWEFEFLLRLAIYLAGRRVAMGDSQFTGLFKLSPVK